MLGEPVDNKYGFQVELGRKASKMWDSLGREEWQNARITGQSAVMQRKSVLRVARQEYVPLKCKQLRDQGPNQADEYTTR